MKYVIFIFFNVFPFSTKSQIKLVDSIITEQSLIKHVSALANDSMQGRLMNTPGNKLAAKYIISQFENLGLKKMTQYPDMKLRS
jgi:hypothetical protein